MGTISRLGDLETKKIPELTVDAKEYSDNSEADNTKKAYKSDLKFFEQWAQKHDVRHLPASGVTVANYISHLAKIGRAVSTISRVLSSISQDHKLHDFDNPTKTQKVAKVHRGIKRKNGTAQNRAKALVIADLKIFCDGIRPTFLGRRDKALVLVGWSGALRRSELVALNLEDIDFVDQGMTLQITRSKTDQQGAGYKIGIPFAADKQYCPVLNLKKWIDLARLSSGPLFIAVGNNGKKFHAVIDEPRRLSAAMVNTVIKRRAKQAGINTAGLSGHSLRAGFVTSAAKIKVPEYVIQDHTRHRSVRVLRSYIRDTQVFEDNPLALLL